MEQKRHYVRNTVELLYLGLMLQWERTAPLDRHKGLLDGVPAVNSQTARLAYVLNKIAAGAVERTFQRLACARSLRRKDGYSYISKEPGFMKEPYPLHKGWYLEGDVSLKQKQGFIQHLADLGLSPTFVASIDDFVAGKTILQYMPTDEEQAEIERELRERGEFD